MNTFACIDIGGTALKYGRLQSDGTICSLYEAPSQADQGASVLCANIKEAIRTLLEEDPFIQGIAISSAGVVDPKSARILHASDAIPNYAHTCFRKELEEFLLPVEAENDVCCAALCEAEHFKERPALMITVGTGIGGALMLETGIYHGHSFCACEVGYLPVDGLAFEKQASTQALVGRVAERKQEPAVFWNGRRIFEAASSGDLQCLEEIERMCGFLGKGLAALCVILNPEVIILGGGIMARKDVLKEPVEKSFKTHALPLIAEHTRLEFAACENLAGMKGALIHFLQRHPELAC